MLLPPVATCPGRYAVTVQPGSTNRIRIINAGMSVYMTVCFQGHNVTVVALDAAPTAPVTFNGCVDVNLGQRCVRMQRIYNMHYMGHFLLFSAPCPKMILTDCCLLFGCRFSCSLL
jgi:Multicopper oxidase